MPDYFVCDTAPDAQAVCDSVWSRQRDLLVAAGHPVDDKGCVIGKRSGVPDPSAQRTVCWDTPQQRLDGKWIAASPDSLPTASDKPQAAKGLTVAAYVTQDVVAAVVQTFDQNWLAVLVTVKS